MPAAVRGTSKSLERYFRPIPGIPRQAPRNGDAVHPVARSRAACGRIGDRRGGDRGGARQPVDQQRNTRKTLSRRIEAFHGPMMLDHARNAAYAAAIERAVRPGMLVLEVGAGSGLLALIAARAGADVVTCEENPLIAVAAQRIVERNGMTDRIRVIAKRSDALHIPDDMPRPADLVIHEIFGSRIFDEGVTGALTDARQRLLRPGAPSIPRSANIVCALVAGAKPPETLADVLGFDLSPFELLVRPARSVWSSVRRGLERRSAPGSALPMDYDSPPPFGAASDSVILRIRRRPHRRYRAMAAHPVRRRHDTGERSVRGQCEFVMGGIVPVIPYADRYRCRRRDRGQDASSRPADDAGCVQATPWLRPPRTVPPAVS